MANKIKYGISNVHYAVLGTTGYGTPVAIPGAVSISLAAEGDRNVFYADDIEYYVVNVNNGYSGDLELALIPDTFRQQVLGEALENTSKVLVENASGAEAIKFALGFDVKGDDKVTKFWFYNCTASRPEEASQTKEDQIAPATEKVTISCKPDDAGHVRAKTTDTTTTSVIAGWYSTVFTPTN